MQDNQGKDSRHQVRLELIEIDVQGPVETQRGGDGRDNLSDEPVEVGEARRSDAKPLLADIVDSFIVDLAYIPQSRLKLARSMSNVP